MLSAPVESACLVSPVLNIVDLVTEYRSVGLPVRLFRYCIVMDEQTLDAYMFPGSDELRSYSASFESRARDRFVALVNDLVDLGSHEEYQKMFFSDRIMLQKKNRRLLDYIEVQTFLDRVEIVSLNDEVTKHLFNIIPAEKGFADYKYDAATHRITIPLPPLSMNALLEMRDSVDGKFNSVKKAFGLVRAQTAQQVKAGIENEFIFQIDAAKVSKEIELVMAHYLDHAMVFAMAKKAIIMGKYTPKDKQESELFSRVPTAVKLLNSG